MKTAGEIMAEAVRKGEKVDNEKLVAAMQQQLPKGTKISVSSKQQD